MSPLLEIASIFSKNSLNVCKYKIVCKFEIHQIQPSDCKYVLHQTPDTQLDSPVWALYRFMAWASTMHYQEPPLQTIWIWKSQLHGGGGLKNMHTAKFIGTSNNFSFDTILYQKNKLRLWRLGSGTVLIFYKSLAPTPTYM